MNAGSGNDTLQVLSPHDAFKSAMAHRNTAMRDHRKIAQDFARRLKAKYGDRVEQVILFGSVARGEHRDDSDIDMLVLTRDTSWDFRLQLASEAVEVLLREGLYISAKPVAPEAFETTQATLFGRNVRREGLVLA